MYNMGSVDNSIMYLCVTKGVDLKVPTTQERL